MKKTLPFLAAATVTLLAGCASNPATRNTVEVVDYQKIQAIEQAADHYNVRVIWVNKPTKRVTAGG